MGIFLFMEYKEEDIMFPFGSNKPRKNKDLIKYDFVDTYSKVERRLLTHILSLKGYLIDKDLNYKEGYLAVGLPKSKGNDLVRSGFNIYVRAEQVYHGAHNYLSIYDYMSDNPI